MLEITLTRRDDDRVTFRITRPDGTATWQVHAGPRAWFFSFHDLTHLAVETVLRTRDGFYGLIGAGWDIEDTGGKGARGSVPLEAVLVEHIVGLIERERIGGAEPLAAAEVNALLSGVAGSAPIVALSDAQLARVRAERDRLHDAWAATPAGQALRLGYARPDRPALV